MEVSDIISPAGVDAKIKKSDYMKKRYEIKGDKLREQYRNYYQKNKDTINERRKQKYIEKHGNNPRGKPRKAAEDTAAPI